MVSKLKLMPDDLEIDRRRRSQRSCTKSPLARVIAVSLIVIIALMMSLIYYSIVLDRMDKLKEYMLYNMQQAEHSTTIDQEDSGLALRVRSSKESTAADMSSLITTAIDHDSVHIKRLQMKFFRRRLPRDVTQELLDPLQNSQQTINFDGLYARVRNKRQRSALSKLEREYVRCKKESKEGNDCMLAFVKMYNIAKDISERMEQMKEIFKDSEAVLLRNSHSKSQESKETKNLEEKSNKAQNNNKNTDEQQLGEIDVTEEVSSPITSTATTPATSKKPKLKKIRPSKISWIIDGHDDYYEDEEAMTEYKEAVTKEALTTTINPPATVSRSINFSTATLIQTAQLENTTFPADATGLDDLPETFPLDERQSKPTANGHKGKFQTHNQTKHTKTAEETSEKNVEETAEDATKEAAEKSADKATEKPVEEFFEKTTEKTVEQSIDQITEKGSQKAAGQDNEEATETITKKMAEDIGRETTTKIIGIVVENIDEKKFEKKLTVTSADQVTDQSADRAADQKSVKELFKDVIEKSFPGSLDNSKDSPLSIKNANQSELPQVDLVPPVEKELHELPLDMTEIKEHTKGNAAAAHTSPVTPADPALANKTLLIAANLRMNSTSTASADIIKDLDSGIDSIEDLPRSKFDWIIDGGEDDTAKLENSSTITTVESKHTTIQPTFPTKPKPIKFDWIIDSDVVSSELATPKSISKIQTTTTVSLGATQAKMPESLGGFKVKRIKETTEPAVTITYGGDCAKVSSKCANNSQQRKAHTATEAASTTTSTTAHPLDDPSSLENMLDSFEQKLQEPLIKAQVQVETGAMVSKSSVSDVAAKTSEQQYKKIKQQQELINTFGDMNVTSETLLGAKINPVNSKGFEKNPQFLTLCEHMAQKLRNQAQDNAEIFQQSPGMQTFAHRGSMGGGFPVTGETIKASAQFMFNPSFGMPTIPVCFYVTPASFRMYNQPPMWMPNYYGPPGFYGSSNGGFMGGSPYGPMGHISPITPIGGGGSFMPGVSGGPGGVFFVPQNFAGSPHNYFSQSSGSATAFHHNNNNQSPNIFSKHSSTVQKQAQTQAHYQSQSPPQRQGQQFYCTYLQQPSTPSSSDTVGPDNGNLAASGFSNANFKMRASNHSSAVDIIYASFASLPTHMDHVEEFKCTLPDEKACFGGNECIAVDSWCDNRVDCTDGSDEAACSCRSRLADLRICDGYADCPMGEDEIGCFGCGDFMYSCYERPEDYELHNRSTVSMCYSSLEKCDGIKNCLNGKDEQECSLIVEDVGSVMAHSVSAAEGYLYHNHRGEWFPVCNNALKWAKEACEAEGGPPDTTLSVSFHEIRLPGPFIEPTVLGTVHFPQTCQKRDSKDVLTDHVAYVKCAPAKCGVTKSTATIWHTKMKSRRSSRMLDNSDNKGSAFDALLGGPRIVGGIWSRPLQWPFVAALYRNGNFHCGCTIYSELWIISAAHCVINFQKYYYEVRAGLHRRSSYAAATQIRAVAWIVAHQEYERLSMRNDLSLLRLAEPLRFNRWVKPICLPAPGRTAVSDQWLWGPKENTLCTVVGWGAVREKGPGSDQLREVIVPIRKDCVEKEDRDAEDICAGDASGGRDACQGDSGGPLFCRSVANADEWYLAGVVSHGNGCARPGEFGVYTRVALYLEWIETSTNKTELQEELQPLQLCPGYICIWGGKRCMPQRKRCDRIVDCLGGEDEVGCVYNFIPDVGSAQNTTSTTVSDYFPEVKAEQEKEEEEEIKRVTLAQLEAEVAEGPHFESKKKIRTLSPIMTTLAYVDEVQTTLQAINDEDRAESDVSTELDPQTTTEGHITKLSTELTPLKSTAEVSTTEKLLTTRVRKMNPTTEKLTTAMATTAQLTTESISFTKGISTATSTTTKFSSESTKISLSSTPRSLNIKQAARSMNSTANTKFGEFKPTIDAPGSPNIHVDVHKRENATVPGAIAKQKFICQSIPQIIEHTQRCDRILDCEDGTDEENCSCRDYLKGPLKALICDGKPDCEDLTDEEDCDPCNAEEFYCSVSKTCISLTKRCDGTVDCKFQEDEKECFALTNGKEIILDVHRHPVLRVAGVFSRNSQGVWRVVCAHEIGFHQRGASTANEACALLGFNGVKFYNTTEYLTSQEFVPIDPVIGEKSRITSELALELEDNINFSSPEGQLPFRKKVSKLRIESIPSSDRKCLGLYVECHAKSNKSQPLKIISAGHKPLSSTSSHMPKLDAKLTPHARPNVLVKPQLPPVILEKKKAIMAKLDDMIEISKNLTVVVNNKLHEGVEELHWPWVVDVYKNGNLWCVGVLVEQHWVLVHESCYSSVRLQTDYIAVLLGGGKTKQLQHKSTQEQIQRVDCLVNVPNSDVILFHLQDAVRFTHYVLPIFLPDLAKYNKSAHHECIALLHDDYTGRIKSVAVKSHNEDQLCKNAQIACYQLLASKPPTQLINRTDISYEELANLSEEVKFRSDEVNTTEETSALSQFTTCKQFGNRNRTGNFDAIDQGVLVCREQHSGWYPTALFAYNNTDCSSFQTPFGVRTLEKSYQQLQQIIDNTKCEHSYSTPTCATHRCPLGRCLEAENICDGKNDCHDGSDENKELCAQHKRACKPFEMRCRSSQKCIPKTKFCDHVPDCEDFTDEPTVCSCYTYLQATDPSKICDGVRNCWDKSDESPVFCNCTANRFPCGRAAKECISRDFVCDKEADCPNGEDEAFCFGIEQPLKKIPFSGNKYERPTIYGQVIEQSYGIWHTKCFPRDTPPDISEVRQICKKLGYKPYGMPTYRLIDDVRQVVVDSNESSRQVARNINEESLVGKYRDATKAVVVSRFSPLHLNEELTLFLKPSRPMAELTRWNATDSKNCYRMEVKCA